MTSYHLHRILLVRYQSPLLLPELKGRKVLHKGLNTRRQELLEAILARVCQSWKNLSGESGKTSRLRKTSPQSGHCDEMCDVFHVDLKKQENKPHWENSFADIWKSEGRLDRWARVRSQRASLCELRSIPKEKGKMAEYQTGSTVVRGPWYTWYMPFWQQYRGQVGGA